MLVGVGLGRLRIVGQPIDLDIVVFVLGIGVALLVERVCLGHLAFHALGLPVFGSALKPWNEGRTPGVEQA